MQFLHVGRAKRILEIQELHAMNIECHQPSFLTNSGEWKTVLTLDLNRTNDVLWSASLIFLWLRVGSVQIYHSNIDELTSFLKKTHNFHGTNSAEKSRIWWRFSMPGARWNVWLKPLGWPSRLLARQTGTAYYGLVQHSAGWSFLVKLHWYQPLG